MRTLLLIATAVMLSCYAGRPDPKHSANLTLYHINPLNKSGIENMDLGDAQGDMFFDFTVVMAPFSCPNPFASCDNREVIGPNIGLKKVVVEFDTRLGPYGSCNICVNGTDPHNKSQPCKGDEYVCECNAGVFPPKTLACEPKVGVEYPTKFFGAKGIGGFCRFGALTKDPSNCWIGAAAEKLNGTWYSPMSLGKCNDDDTPCAWRFLSVEKTVTRDCHLNAWHTEVEKHFEAGCIDSCTDSGIGPARNTSSKCWVRCWSEAALGKEAGKWPWKQGGMSVQALTDAWVAPFESEDPLKGGCPNVPATSTIVI